MYKYKVKFNEKEIVVNENSQFSYKSNYHLNKKNYKTSKVNFFEILIIANDFLDCLEKAKNIYRSQYNKDASSIEVIQLQNTTNSSVNLSNKQKLVA